MPAQNKKFYITFHKDDRELAFKYTVVEATIHSDAAIYADEHWGSKVNRVLSSGQAYEMRRDRRFSQLQIERKEKETS